FEDNLELLDGVHGLPLHHAFERDTRVRRQLALAELLAAVLDNLLGDLVVLGSVDLITGVGHAIETEDLDGRRRTGNFDAFTAIIEHRANLAERTAGEEDVTDAQRALLDEDGRHRTAVAIETRFD